MKQRLMALAALLCCAVVMMAETVSPSEARQAAMNFLKSQGATLRNEAARAKSQSQVGSIYLPEALEAGDYRIDMLISKYFAPTYLENYFPFDSVSLTVNPTGVVEVKSEELRVNNENINYQWFDLNGRPVTKPRHGLYLRNGKKIFVE